MAGAEQLLSVSGAGVMLDVNPRSRQLSIARLDHGIGETESAMTRTGSRRGGPNFSLLQNDAIAIRVTNHRFAEIGPSGKVRVSFDVSIRNQLNVNLAPPDLYLGSQTPSFLMLFPVLAKAELTTGSANRDPDGILAVDAFNTSFPIEPSPEWDGTGLPGSTARYDFGLDTLCAIATPDCTRWKAFPPLGPGETSPIRTVGFDFDPDVARFKVLLVLAADLTSGEAVPDPPPPSASDRGIPFGPFHLPAESLGQGFSGGLMNASPDSLFSLLENVRERGGRIVLNLAVGRKNYTDPDGAFNLTLWKAQIDRFRGLDFQSYIDDGTIVAHYLIDEPSCTTCWGGRIIPHAALEEMARYSKAIWPAMTTVVRVVPAWLRQAPFQWRYLDAAWAQYEGPLHVPSNGLTPEQFRDKNVLEARSLGLALILGRNVLDGGDGSSGIHGTINNPTRWQMAPSEYAHAGLVFATTPYACAVIDWRWSPSYPEYGYPDEWLQAIRTFHTQPAVQTATRQTGAAARNRATTPCRRP